MSSNKAGVFGERGLMERWRFSLVVALTVNTQDEMEFRVVFGV
jgi:hypothetical protein